MRVGVARTLVGRPGRAWRLFADQIAHLSPSPGRRVLHALVAAIALTLAAGSPGGAATVIDTSTQNGNYSASKFYTHYVNGHYWVAFNKDTQALLYSSPDGVTWTSQGTIFPFTFPADTNYWAVRYQAGRIIALAFNTVDNTRYYREGSLNGTGTVSWSAAPVAVGAPDATNPDLNALIANGRPVLWRAGLNGNGAFWRGSALTGPVWAALPGAVPAHALTSGFTAGAIFPTGGVDPNDLIVLRAFTQNVYAAGNHRLLALKWNDALGAYDGSWYNVSTVGGTLTEDATTEVQATDDANIQRKFAAVADTSGDIHAVYVNGNARVVHYRKAVGFNNAWTRVSSDVLGGDAAAKVALSAIGNGNLFLFYEKNSAQQDIWYRRFDGTSWGSETLLYPGASLGTDLRRALAPIELALGCSNGLAFTTGSTPPYDVNFTLGAGDCSTLATDEDDAAGTITVTAPGSFKMRFNLAQGGGIDEFYDLAEDPTVDLAAGTASHEALIIDEFLAGGNWYHTSRDGAEGQKLDLLEATSTRVRVRQESFYKGSGLFLRGLKVVGDYSVMAPGRFALRWDRRFETDVTYTKNDLELVVHYRAPADPLSNWAMYSQSGAAPNANGDDDFILQQIEQPTAKTDFLLIRYSDWADATEIGVATSAVDEEQQLFWRDNLGRTITGGTTQTWDHLAYFKPTNLVDDADLAVMSRSADYTGPDNPNTTLGSPWNDPDENTAFDKFNEAEGAYLFTLDPSNGLRFTMDGSTTARFVPFFKIRQWRSLAPPATIAFDPDDFGGPQSPITLVRDVDYRADVKPVSRAPFADDLLWHSTLENAAAVTSPDVGTGGAVGGTASPATGRYGQGYLFDAIGEQVTATSSGDFDFNRGAVEFWFKPSYDHGDNVNHRLWGYRVADDFQFIAQKAATNGLRFRILNGPLAADLIVYQVSSADYSWRAGDWVHLRFTWDKDSVLGGQLRIFMNGVELTTSNNGSTYTPNPADWPDGGTLRIGSDTNGNSPASGVIDEFHVYSRPVAPGPTGGAPDPSGQSGLAHGGLTTDASEYLANPAPARNFTLGLAPVDATTGRGQYAYFGSDSNFNGLNISLATPGTSAGVLDLQWEYWNGTSWTSLAVTDETAGLTRNGTVHWVGEPFGWSPYSVNGGPDLYYLRAHLASTSAAYTATPIEAIIKTDVLLFQYCADVTTSSEEFTFAPPVPTAVELLSFEALPADSAVDLSWRTGSELRNLGFHLHRSLSEDGPWTRITPSLIPGLGSSPEGASYSFRDTGLTNGVRYFYRLEDIDSESGSTFHGPVSAVPGSALPADDEGSGDSEGSGEGEESDPSSGDSPGDVAPQTYGHPEATSFRVVSRTKRAVVVELRTPGFLATPSPEGLHVTIPDFDQPTDPRAPDLPLKRVVLDALVGRHARIVWVKQRRTRSFPGLTPAAVGAAEIVSSPDGTVRPGRRAVALRGEGLLPPVAAWIPGDAFIGETKKLALEMNPLRYDASSDTLLLARTLRVKIAFDRKAAREERGRDSRGRRRPRSVEDSAPQVLAHLHTLKKGLHAVSFETLFPQGHDALRLDSLRLSLQGQGVAFHVEPDRKTFGPGRVL
ncbi:MAG: LamG domain-containing protein, partial [Acidobacteriota bacterium]